MMRIFRAFLLVASVQAFAPSPSLQIVKVLNSQLISNTPFKIQSLHSSSNGATNDPTTSKQQSQTKLTHGEIEWRLGPSEDTPPLEKLKIKAAANAIRTELLLKGEIPPPILCPKGGKALLEACIDGE